MSAGASRLASLLLNEYFGELVAQVGLVLIQHGKQTMPEVVTESKLKKVEVQKCIVVMMQHGLVVCEGKTPRELYSFLLTTLLRWPSFPKYIALAKMKYGDIGEVIVEDLLKTGRSLFSEVLARSSVKFQNQTDLRDLTEKAETAFADLRRGCCVVCVGRPMSGSTATADGAVPRGNPAVANAPVAVSNNPEDFIPVLKNVMDRIINRKRRFSEDNGEEEGDHVQAAKKMKKNGSEEAPADKGFYWRVNTDKFEQLILHEKIVAAVARRIDTVAATVMEAVFATFPPSRVKTSGPSGDLHVMDVLPQLLTLSLNVTSEQVEQYFKVLCDEKYMKRSGDAGGGSYVFDYNQVSQLLCQGAIESIVMERFGSKSHRIFRLIFLKKYLDQKQISDLAMVPQKEAKEVLYTMLDEHFVSFQEIPRTLTPPRSFYLFTVNQSQVARMLLERCYKSAANVKTRYASEREENRRLLERKESYIKLKEQLAREGTEEELDLAEKNLTPEEKTQIAKIEEVLSNLEQVEMRVCETVRTLTAFLDHGT